MLCPCDLRAQLSTNLSSVEMKEEPGTGICIECTDGVCRSSEDMMFKQPLFHVIDLIEIRDKNNWGSGSNTPDNMEATPPRTRLLLREFDEASPNTKSIELRLDSFKSMLHLTNELQTIASQFKRCRACPLKCVLTGANRLRLTDVGPNHWRLNFKWPNRSKHSVILQLQNQGVSLYMPKQRRLD